MLNRRHLLAGALAVPAYPLAIATAQETATPNAAAATTDEVLPDWIAARDALSELGNTVSDALFAAKVAPIVAVADDNVAAVLTSDDVPQQVIDQFTIDQIRFSFSEVNAWFYGQVTPTGINGFMIQGATFAFQAAPEEPQAEAHPTGSWRGVIGPGVLDLQCLLEFSGTADALEVLLSIPAQMLIKQPMTDVSLQADVPIGERLDERSMPIGGDIIATNLWSAEYEWGGQSLTIQTVWDTSMRLAGLTLVPVPPLPVEEVAPIPCRLPFDGAWLVFWGGETTFANYHAATAPQRHALDLAIWQDGATSTGTGQTPEEYWCFGQSLISPVAGTVVHMQDGFEDIQPQGAPNASDHPAGNHIVIQTEGGFIYLAHCKLGTIQVVEGDEVVAGDVVAQVGNSGNTSEPHIHIHAQSVADFYDPAAVGIPLVFTDLLINGEHVDEALLQHGQIVEPM